MGLSRSDFRDLFDSERDSLHRFLYRLTGNRTDAEDLLQEAFMTVWRKREQFAGRGSREGYLRRTAYRLYLNHLQKTRRRSDLAPPPPPTRSAPAAPAAARQVADKDAHSFLMARVREELAALTDDAREAFVLFRFEGLTCPQIADLTETPVKTVETRVRRATATLAARLGRYRHHLQAG